MQNYIRLGLYLNDNNFVMTAVNSAVEP